MSNIAAREAWRAHSIISPAVKGTIQGLGRHSYSAGAARAGRDGARSRTAADAATTLTRPHTAACSRLPDRRLPGADGRAGVRQRGAALRLQLRHHGVRGGVALALRLADLPGRGRGAAGARATSARTCWSAGSPARQEGLPRGRLRPDAAASAGCCSTARWSRRRSTGTSPRPSAAPRWPGSTASAWCSPCSAALILLHDLVQAADRHAPTEADLGDQSKTSARSQT